MPARGPLYEIIIEFVAGSARIKLNNYFSVRAAGASKDLKL